jgi:hypothetical protein
MQKSLITSLLLTFTMAGGTVIIQQDPIFKDKTNIKTESGELKGYLKRNPVFPDKMNVYDVGGKLKGYIKQDPMEKDRWKFNGEGGEERRCVYSEEGTPAQENILTLKFKSWMGIA